MHYPNLLIRFYLRFLSIQPGDEEIMDEPCGSLLSILDDPIRVSRSLAGNRLLLCVLDEVENGMLLVDGAGRLHYANALGRDELFDEAVLHLRDGIVGPTLPARRVAFRKALEEALSGRRQLLTFSTGTATMAIAVTPLAEGDDCDFHGGSRYALLVFGKRPDTTGLAIHFFACAHGLTGAESTVLEHLAKGFDPCDVARHQCVRISTVRSQIASIRAKTRKGSVRELLDCLAMLPPVRTIARLTARTMPRTPVTLTN